MTTVVDGEPGWGDACEEARRLLRRAARRRLLHVALTAVAVLGAVAMASRRPARQRSVVFVRLTETDTRSSRLTWNDRALRGYVTEVAFSHRALADVIHRRRLFRSAGPEVDEAAKVALLRERMTIEVIQNHVISLIPPAERPRSAHVRIAYDDADPARGLQVAIDLADVVVATRQTQRRADARMALQRAALEAEDARAALERLRAEATRLTPVEGVAAAQARLSSLRAGVRAAERRLDQAEEARLAADLRLREGYDAPAGLEAVRLEPPPPAPPIARGPLLAGTGIAATLAAAPVLGLLIGAFDRRIHDGGDVRHLGLRYLGRLVLRPARAGRRRREAAPSR